MNQELFQRDYPDIETILNDIVYPVFGNSAAIRENILTDSTILSKAKDAGIKSATRIAEYDADGTPLNIFDVELDDSVDVARNRINIKRWLISHSDVYSASLIFFHYTVPGKEWRISFFAKNSSNSDVTSAKRYTFLCGQEHGCRTVAQRFELLRKSDKTLDKLREAFSVEALNKEFYAKLSNWFFWALQHVKFPEKESQVPLIRLITRTIFVWFMRRKELIPAELFDKKYIDSILKKDCDASSYYKAILQNLFFATLNTEHDSADNRKFQAPEYAPGRNHQYHVYTCYRYEDFFTDSGKESFLKLVKDIPFLNGGLFSCLDDNEDNIIIDAFSNHPANREKLVVPDELFWTTEEDNKIVNLNDIYGDKKHGKEKVLGLIPLLSQYNFTIDESSRDEFTVALDPELLGMVFENLLASYNPETSVTAKKSTGSFYTPRDIVDYMVEESLCRYILNTITACGLTEDDIRDLVASDNHPNFSHEQKSCVIEAINNCKILDPACGSGAFPIGLLQNLVRILEKLDPVGCQKDLYDRKLHLIQNCIYGVDIQPIAVQISKLRCFISLLAESEVEPEQKNCGIEPLPNLEMHFVAANSLLDVNLDAFDWTSDIQVQKLTSELQEIRAEYFSVKTHAEKKKLRKADKAKREELKKLLISLSSTGDADKVSRLKQEIIKLEAEQAKYLEEKWEDATSNDLFPGESESLFKVDANKAKRDQLAKKLKECQKDLEKESAVVTDTINQEAAKLADWNPFNQMASSPFFNPKWMFNIEDGFNIVIGNPPYGLINKKQNKGVSIITDEETFNFYKDSPYYADAQGHGINIFRLFVIRSAGLLATNGIFSEIFPLAYAGDLSAARLRNHVFSNYTTLLLDAFPERDDKNKRVFEAVKMSVCILFLQNAQLSTEFVLRIHPDKDVSKEVPSISLTADIIRNIDPVNMTIPLVSEEDFLLLNRICQNTVRLATFAHCATGELDMTLSKEAFTTNPQDAPMFRGAVIDQYLIRKTMSQGEFLYVDEKILASMRSDMSEYKNGSRIALQGITGVNEKTRLKATIVSNGYCANSVNYIKIKEPKVSEYYLLALLNSSVLNFYFSKFSTNSNVNGYEVDALPIVIPLSEQDKQISDLVKKVLAAKSADPDADTSALETKIDNLVNQLYGMGDKVRCI